MSSKGFNATSRAMETVSSLRKTNGEDIRSDAKNKLYQNLNDDKVTEDYDMRKGYDKMVGNSSDKKNENNKKTAFEDNSRRKDYLPPINESGDTIKAKTKQLGSSLKEEIKGSQRLDQYTGSIADKGYRENLASVRNDNNKQGKESVSDLKDNAENYKKNNSSKTSIYDNNSDNNTKVNKKSSSSTFGPDNSDTVEFNKEHVATARNKTKDTSPARYSEEIRNKGHEKFSTKQSQYDDKYNTNGKNITAPQGRSDVRSSSTSLKDTSKTMVARHDKHNFTGKDFEDAEKENKRNVNNKKVNGRKNINDPGRSRSKWSDDEQDEVSNKRIRSNYVYADEGDDNSDKSNDDEEDDDNGKGKKHSKQRPVNEVDHRRREYIKTHYGGSFGSYSDREISGNEDNYDEEDNSDDKNADNDAMRRGTRRPLASFGSQEEDRGESEAEDGTSDM